MPRPLVLWGATGQAIVLAEFLPRVGYEVVALFDQDSSVRSPLADVPLFHGWSGFDEWQHTAPEGCRFLVAVGGYRGSARRDLFEQLSNAGLAPATAIHPAAYVATTARVDPGCQVLAGAIIGAQASVGQATIVNTKASVDHDSRIGRGVHIGPGATLCGCVTVEDDAFIGAGATVLPRVFIGRGAVVGAGAVVTKDVPSGTVVVGAPAKVRK